MVSNSLHFIIMLQSRNLAHLWKYALFVAFVSCCLISPTQSQRHWEIKRENGIIETCCFCLIRNLKAPEHTISECKEKFGKVTVLGNIGPPICSCLSSEKYPKCPNNHKVCGRNIECKNNIVYNSCKITELLTEKTMKCNDSLQWEHDINCNETCMPSNTIENGIAKCEILGNKAVCNCTCNEGFVTSQTRNMSCIEAKKTICIPVEVETETETNLLQILLPLGIILLLLIILYCIWKKTGCPSCFSGNVPNGNCDIALVPNGNVPNGNVPNGNVPNGNCHIAQDSNNTPGAQDSNNTPRAQDSNNTPRAQDSNNTPGAQDSNNTPGAQDSNNTPRDDASSHTPGDQETRHTPEDPESLLYPNAYPSMGYPSFAESLENSVQQGSGRESQHFSEDGRESQHCSEDESSPLLESGHAIRLSEEETGKPNFQE